MVRPSQSVSRGSEALGHRGCTSRILVLWASLSVPARQQRVKALWMMNLLDLELGSLKSFGPANQTQTQVLSCRVSPRGCSSRGLYLCIRGRASFQWNRPPSLDLRWELPVYWVSHIPKVNQDGCWRNAVKSRRPSHPVTLTLAHRCVSMTFMLTCVQVLVTRRRLNSTEHTPTTECYLNIKFIYPATILAAAELDVLTCWP